MAGESGFHDSVFFCSLLSSSPLGRLPVCQGRSAALYSMELPPVPHSFSGSCLAAYGVKKNMPQSPTVVSTGVSTSAGKCCRQLPEAGPTQEALFLSYMWQEGP